MHLLKTHLCLLLCIGMFSLGVKADEPTDEEFDEMAKKHLVYVEPSAAVKIHPETEDAEILPYKDRRGHYGALIGVNYSSYVPTKYQPNFEDGGYSDWYGAPSMPSIELHVQPKKNISVGSVGVDLGASTFKSSASDGGDLSLILVQVGLVFNADRLFTQPYVVPYVEGGAYTVFYNESTTTGDSAFTGNSAIAPFLAAGLNLQLDWLDPESAATTYKQTSLKSFFLFIEDRQYLASGKSGDPDFSGNFYNVGLKAEF